MIRVLCTLVAVLAVSMLSGNATAQTGTLPPLPCPAYIVPPFDNVPIWVPQPITPEDATDCLVTYQNAVNAARKKHEKDWCACTTAQCRLDADRQFLRDIQDARDALYQCFEDAVGPNPNPDPGEDPNEWTDPVTNDPDCYRCPDALMFFFAYGVSYVEPWSMVGCLGNVDKECLEQVKEAWADANRAGMGIFLEGWCECWNTFCAEGHWFVNCLQPRLDAYNQYMQEKQQEIIQRLLDCGACEVAEQ